jgi:hypothetical protein
MVVTKSTKTDKQKSFPRERDGVAPNSSLAFETSVQYSDCVTGPLEATRPKVAAFCAADYPHQKVCHAAKPTFILWDAESDIAHPTLKAHVMTVCGSPYHFSVWWASRVPLGQNRGGLHWPIRPGCSFR